MTNVIRRIRRIGGAAGAATLLAGCGLSGIGGSPGGPPTGPPVTITQHVTPSALLSVVTAPASGPALSGLVASTARPDEDVRILQAGTLAATIVDVRLPRADSDHRSRGRRWRRAAARRTTRPPSTPSG